MFIEKKKPTPCITKEMPPNIIKISDTSDLDKEDNDEVEASLKELFPGQSKESVLGLRREEAKRDSPSLSRSACLQLQNQSHHIPLRVKTQWLQLENTLRSCFNNFKKVNAPRMTVPKWLLIRY